MKRNQKNMIKFYIHCDIKVQRERVLTRDKISDSLFKKIVSSQLSFNDKIKFKPQVINTNYKLLMLINIFLLLITTLIRLRLKNGKKKISTRYRNNRFKF